MLNTKMCGVFCDVKQLGNNEEELRYTHYYVTQTWLGQGHLVHVLTLIKHNPRQLPNFWSYTVAHIVLL